MERPDPLRLLPELITLARAAGAEIMRHYEAGVTVSDKADGSPVTAADQAGETIILAGLAQLAPHVPVLAEEAVAGGKRPAPGSDALFLLDPLDGTKEFIKRNGEFTVNIALAFAGVPVLGVVYAPAMGLLYAGGPAIAPVLYQDDAPPRAIKTRSPPADGLTVLVSRSHDSRDDVAALLSRLPITGKLARGSSLKLCAIAAGEGDLYPRLGPTSEWDIAAGHAILAGAGGHVRRLSDGKSLDYGKADILNPSFVAIGCEAAWPGLWP